jgi:hypothetical protein
VSGASGLSTHKSVEAGSRVPPASASQITSVADRLVAKLPTHRSSAGRSTFPAALIRSAPTDLLEWQGCSTAEPTNDTSFSNKMNWYDLETSATSTFSPTYQTPLEIIAPGSVVNVTGGEQYCASLSFTATSGTIQLLDNLEIDGGASTVGTGDGIYAYGTSTEANLPTTFNLNVNGGSLTVESQGILSLLINSGGTLAMAPGTLNVITWASNRPVWLARKREAVLPSCARGRELPHSRRTPRWLHWPNRRRQP